MANNNSLLKGIAKNTGSKVKGTHSDNYYLKRIEENTKKGGSGGVAYDDTEIVERVTDLETAVGNKVDKVTGKGLSKNDFTDNLKSKLENDVLTSHQDITGKADKSDFDTIDVLVTYEDDSTETITLYCVNE